MDTPEEPARRIRHISGVGIHELTLPGLVVTTGSPRMRRTSHSSLEAPHGRSRAPTLAGEGLHPHPHPVPVPEAGSDLTARPLARCFVSLTLPEEDPLPSPPPTPVRSSSAASRTRPSTRARTTSLPPKPVRSSSSSSLASIPSIPPSPGSPRRNGSAWPEKRSNRPAQVRRSTLGFPARTERAGPVPFFLSPIHEPSTQPRWANIERGDLAPWITGAECAGSRVDLAVWVEERGKWHRLPGVGGIIDLSELVPVPQGAVLPPNSVEFTFTSSPRTAFYLPPEGEIGPRREDEKGVVERSMRETRMKKGANFGGLHQLVNIQSVIADTGRSIADLQHQIDTLISADSDRSTLKRDVSERALRVRWIRDRVAEVERTTEEARARMTLHRGRLDARRALLKAAIERAEQTRAQSAELTTGISDIEEQRADILPQIYKRRARHAQDLDALFPIVPIDAPSLLYSVLGVPLPIPIGPKDPAPPLSLTPQQTPEGCPRIDERTTAAALGYAALVLQLIANLGGAAAGLAYPVTYAGSKSHVRDVVSVMQGPRSFPLYGRGVERYRYEYAVFLLNKDIELLMYEADIRMLDLRHTLPNLKNILLNLCSSEPPAPGPVMGPGWASGAGSRTSSRQPSLSWALRQRSASLASIGSIPRRSVSVSLQGDSPSLAAASIVSVGPTSTAASDSQTGFTTPPTVSPPHWTSPQRSSLSRVAASAEEDSGSSSDATVEPESPRSPPTIKA
ncbi:uncharacterized protein CcaverHIS019_0508570 [Cutaneotrichosporon cavernicola]|uniref:UV radiation resistance-associated gene protein n=1 Tax=Cutaneotrichosporon cavernicola TaxID=279322 RepID=A0AA48L750_9TREE|nr:uncharacterized protein CcaverHIS019_0508570 [Cutaneotrichosporon cavernicola]BEI93229.1 hypothetical protein CcaverHIS019_0508570 [Cutaneotrichosporon cavernicola]BEJ01006.1 hypothetical protein CcaverHIS631_0508630 [Cutaneotrichosporon cavernicola]BEJ08773.1 hypothetical protein CcaverHIS641_0508670 [Cutaneotrichosporon cavernicola]